MNVEHIADATFLQLLVQSSHVKGLLFSMCSLAFGYRYEARTVRRPAKCNLTLSSMEDAVIAQSGQKVVEERIQMTLLDGCHRCSAVQQMKAEGGHE